jgi:cysteinyl-tRNA synthetase
VFSYEALEQATGTYKKLKKRVADLSKDGAVDNAAVEEYKAKFVEAVGNDVNTSMGITLVYDVLKTDLNDVTKRAIIESYDYVLGLDLLKEEVQEENAGVDAELEAYVLAKIEERKAAKKAKDFALADAIRNELLEQGIVLKDTREGVKWERA